MKHTDEIPRGNRAGDKDWSTSEVARLRDLAAFGADVVAAELGRTVKAVTRQAERQRISLRRQGEHRGRVVGQPASVSYIRGPLAAVRERRLADPSDHLALQEFVRRELEGDLCPRCSAAPIENDLTGLCTVCHIQLERRRYQRLTLEQKERRGQVTDRQHRRRMVAGKEEAS